MSTTDILLTLSVVIIVEVSRFPDSVKRGLGIWLGKPVRNLKPLDCSFCLTFWVLAIYHLVTGTMSVMTFACALVMATLTPAVSEAVYLFRDGLITLFRKLNERL